MSPAGRGAHVLVISFGYEPLQHVSAARGSAMSRELAALGWEVSALTVDWSHPLPPHVRSAAESVERALAEPSPRRIAIDGRLANPAFDPLAVAPDTEPPAPRLAPLRKLRSLRQTLSDGPFPGWARQARAAAEALHRARPIDVVWAIRGDDSCHALAHALHAGLGVPWVADFKDAWSRYHTRLARPVQRFATGRRLRSAAALTETCAAQAERDAREFGRPTEVVYSGYDEALMADAPPRRPGDGFCILYPGRIGHAHDPRPVPALFAELARRGALESGQIELHQVAKVAGQFGPLLAGVGCADRVRDHAPLPRAELFGLMRGADVLLLLPATARDYRQLGLKEIECVAAGTPVLVLGEPLEELLPLFRAAGQVCVAGDAGRAADFVEAELRARQGAGGAGDASRRGPANGPALRELTWSAQARRLSEILAGCLGPAASR